MEIASGWRRQFDAARTPYDARIALGIITTAGSFQPLDGDLTSLAGATGTNTIYYRSGTDTWSPVTIGGNMTFVGGVLNSVAGGGGISDAPSDGKTYGRKNAAWIDAWASPALTGTPTVPTATAGTNTTQAASTAFVTAADNAVKTQIIGSASVGMDTLGEIENYIIANINPALGNKADIFSPTFTGDPKAPTPTAGDNDTSIATTAFVTAAVAAAAGSGTRVLLATATPASGATSVVFDSSVITSTYDVYELEVFLFNNSGASAAAVLLFSTNNGASYASSYQRAAHYSTQAATGGDVGTATATSILLTPSAQTSSTTPLTATAKIYKPTTNGIWHNVHIQGASFDGTNFFSWTAAATYSASTSPITNFKVQLEPLGGFASGGFVKLYGLK